MAIVGIILAIAGMIFCITTVIIHLYNGEWGGAFCMSMLFLLNCFLLGANIDKQENIKSGKLKTEIVKDVVKYQVDSTIIINGSDTTKTYTLRYLKNYE